MVHVSSSLYCVNIAFTHSTTFGVVSHPFYLNFFLVLAMFLNLYLAWKWAELRYILMSLFCSFWTIVLVKLVLLRLLLCSLLMLLGDTGHYPEWDEDHPIHFVGHSAGAQVIRVLQQMLADKVGLNGFV